MLQISGEGVEHPHLAAFLIGNGHQVPLRSESEGAIGPIEGLQGLTDFRLEEADLELVLALRWGQQHLFLRISEERAWVWLGFHCFLELEGQHSVHPDFLEKAHHQHCLSEQQSVHLALEMQRLHFFVLIGILQRHSAHTPRLPSSGRDQLRPLQGRKRRYLRLLRTSHLLEQNPVGVRATRHQLDSEEGEAEASESVAPVEQAMLDSELSLRGRRGLRPERGEPSLHAYVCI